MSGIIVMPHFKVFIYNPSHWDFKHMLYIHWYIHYYYVAFALRGKLQYKLQPTCRHMFLSQWDSFVPLLMTGRTGEQLLHFGPLSEKAALTKTRFICYLPKSASFLVFPSSLFPFPLNQIRSGGKKFKLFQPGSSRLHPHFILHPGKQLRF